MSDMESREPAGMPWADGALTALTGAIALALMAGE